MKSITNARNAVRVAAPAKINLFLHVGLKRTDGFHDLQSLVVFAEESDHLRLADADDISLSVDGPFAKAVPLGNENLVVQAASIFASLTERPPRAQMLLTKNLPVASGIGGGSADAAATLRGLWSLWGLAHPGDEILWGHREPFANRKESLLAATSLGSDVPVCLLCGPAWMEGRGERVWSLSSFPDAALVLINPGVAVSTAEVFGRLEKRSDSNEVLPLGFGNSVEDLVAYLGNTRNDLEPPARSLAPVIGRVVDTLRSSGALLSRMSGSGATCFGIFKKATDSETAAADIRRAYPHWWVRATRIATRDIGRPGVLVQ